MVVSARHFSPTIRQRGRDYPYCQRSGEAKRAQPDLETLGRANRRRNALPQQSLHDMP